MKTINIVFFPRSLAINTGNQKALKSLQDSTGLVSGIEKRSQRNLQMTNEAGR